MPSVTAISKTIAERVLSAPSATAPATQESLSKLSKKFSAQREMFADAFTSSDFYVQLLMVGIAFSIAWLMSVLIRQRIRQRLIKHPPRRIDSDFLLKPLKLLTPLLAMIYLSVVKPFSDEFASELDVTHAAFRLCIAYFFARIVVMVVKSRLVAYFVAASIMVVAALNVSGFAQYTVVYLNSMAFEIGQFRISLLNLFHGLFILVIVFWIAGVLSRTLESYLRRSSRLSYTARELTVKFFRIFVYFVAFMVTLSALGVDLTAFAVFSGALGVGVGLGLQKLTANFVSGITILMEKSIKIGDLIEIGSSSGSVRELNIRYALIETVDGREIMIPNEELVSTRVTNWSLSSNHARVDIKITVEYGSNAARVREILLGCARAYPHCMKTPAPNCWLREFSDNGLLFLLVFWIPNVHDGRFGPQSEVMLTIIERFAKEGITFATAPSNPRPPIEP